MVKEINVNGGFKALVDDDDYNLISSYKWRVQKGGSKKNPIIYARTGKRSIKMHRMLLNATDGFDVDHINGNGLDNRRCNIRVVTRSQNLANTSQHKDSNRNFKGVGFIKFKNGYIPPKPYQAWICVNYKHICLGTYATEIEAARAYDIAAIKYFGDAARLNFNTVN